MKNYIKPELSIENYFENVAVAFEDPFDMNGGYVPDEDTETQMSAAGWWDLIIG